MLKYIRVATFNIRHGKGVDNRVSLKRVAATLNNLNPHIAGLQEVDCFMPRSFFQDQAKRLARCLGMHYNYAPNLKYGPCRYGNALLSKFPVLKCENIPLPGELEQRGLQHCLLSLPGNETINFFNTHLGLSSEDREAQVAAIVRRLPEGAKPVILAGDFNTAAISPELQRLSHYLHYTGGIEPPDTYPAGRPRHSIDHIYISGRWRVTQITAVPTLASDHWPLVCILTPNNSRKW